MAVIRVTQMSWIYNLYRLGQGGDSGVQSETVHQRMLEHIVQGFEGESGSLALVDESIVLFDEGTNLTIVAAINIPSHVIGTQIASGQGVLGWVAERGEDLLLNGDLSENVRFQDRISNKHDKAGSSMCWALKIEGRLIGVLSINRTEKVQPFSEEDLAKGKIVTALISTVIDNLHLHQESQQRIAMLNEMNKEILTASQQLEETQSHLLQSDKMASIGQLAAGVAHEINNPIGYVYSNLGTLEKYMQDTFGMLDQYELAESAITDVAVLEKLKTVKEKLDIAFLKEDLKDLMAESKEGIRRVKQIVQNLKDFSHVDVTDEWHFSDLHQGLDSTLNIVSNEVKYKAEVVKDYGKLPDVECLSSQINQVFMNLLVNAAHAIEARGTITIRTGQEGEEVWAEISDTGKGIAQEYLKKIFDPFFTTKPIGKGTGLGLSLSYGIIQKHHGRIEVQSEVGLGTTFRVWLPIKQA